MYIPDIYLVSKYCKYSQERTSGDPLSVRWLPRRFLPTVRDYQKWLCASATLLEDKKEEEEEETEAGAWKQEGEKRAIEEWRTFRYRSPPHNRTSVTEGAIPDHLVSLHQEEGQVI